ncbi:MAG: methyltransferase [Solirubrobacterales bacterium]|nr:methyltransferase [Solirubrobacterales bacterium]
MSLVACPLCGGEAEPLLVARDLNRGISDVRFPYCACTACACVFLAEVPSDLERYYPATYYEADDTHADAPSERAKLSLVQRHATSGRLIEVGPGRGGFAREAHAAGFDVVGVEMDAGACRNLEERIGVQAVHSDDPASVLPTLGPADVIVLWHVIEHVRDPWPVLQGAAQALAPGGILVIATPNPRALQFKLLRSRWPHLDAPRHLSLITADVLAKRAAGHGLALAELVTADRTANDWNAFGWQQLLRDRRRDIAGPLAAKAGSAVALALAPAERRGGRGSTYTAVFRHTQRA